MSGTCGRYSILRDLYSQFIDIGTENNPQYTLNINPNESNVISFKEKRIKNMLLGNNFIRLTKLRNSSRLGTDSDLKMAFEWPLRCLLLLEFIYAPD